MVETIGFPVTANQSSAGDYLPIDSDTLAGCTVTNSSAYAVEYSTGGAWTTIAAGGSATINTGAIATTSLRFRKKTGDSIPVVLSVAVTHPGTTPAQLATDAAGNVAGFSDTINGGVSAFGVSGYRTVLFCDSMTDTFNTVVVPTGLSYDPATGILTVTYAGHQQATGWYINFWHRGYASTIKNFRCQVTVVDANTFTIQLPAGLSGVPSGTVPTSGAQYRPDSWQSAQAFITWLQAASGWRFNIVYNGAQSGDTTQNALDRIQRDCLAYNPHVVIMQMVGINDMSVGNGPIDEETIHSNRKLIVDKILATGAKIILLSTTPVYTGEARGTVQNMSRVIRLNRRLKSYVQGKPNVVWFDAWKRVVDPASTTGLALANMLRTTDNIHYSMRGAKKIADALWVQISSLFPTDFSTLPGSTIDNYTSAQVTLTSVSRTSNVITATCTGHGFLTGEYAKVTGGTSEVLNAWVAVTKIDANTLSFQLSGADGAITGPIYLGRNNNLFDNPILAVGAGGTVVGPVTGAAANHIKVTSLNGSPTAVASVVSRPDGFGNDQQVVITAAAANDQISIEADFALAATLWPTVVKAGRTYVAECECTMTGVSGSNLSEIRWNVAAVVGGATYQTYGLNGYADGATLNSDVTAAHLRTAPMVLPTGTCTNVKFQFVTRFSAAGTAITVKIGRINFVEVDGA